MGKGSKDSISNYEIFKNINSSNFNTGLNHGIGVRVSKLTFRLKFILYTLVFLMAVFFSLFLLFQT